MEKIKTLIKVFLEGIQFVFISQRLQQLIPKLDIALQKLYATKLIFAILLLNDVKEEEIRERKRSNEIVNDLVVEKLNDCENDESDTDFQLVMVLNILDELVLLLESKNTLSRYFIPSLCVSVKEALYEAKRLGCVYSLTFTLSILYSQTSTLLPQQEISNYGAIHKQTFKDK